MQLYVAHPAPAAPAVPAVAPVAALGGPAAALPVVQPDAADGQQPVLAAAMPAPGQQQEGAAPAQVRMVRANALHHTTGMLPKQQASQLLHKWHALAAARTCTGSLNTYAARPLLTARALVSVVQVHNWL